MYKNPVEGFFASYGRDVQESVQNYSGEDFTQDLTMLGPPLIAGLLTMNPQASFATQQMMTKLPSWTQTAASVATLAQGPLAIITCQTQGADSPACQMGAAGLSTGWFTDPIGTVQGLQGSARQVQQVARQGLTELSFASSIFRLPDANNPAGWTLSQPFITEPEMNTYEFSIPGLRLKPKIVQESYSDTLHTVLQTYDDYGTQLQTAQQLGGRGTPAQRQQSVNMLDDLVQEKGYTIQLVSTSDGPVPVINNQGKQVKELLSAAKGDTVRQNPFTKTIYALSHPKFEGVASDNLDLCHDVGACLLGGKLSAAGQNSSIPATTLIRASSQQLTMSQLEELGIVQNGFIPNTWLFDQLIKDSIIKRSLFQ